MLLEVITFLWKIIKLKYYSLIIYSDCNDGVTFKTSVTGIIRVELKKLVNSNLDGTYVSLKNVT